MKIMNHASRIITGIVFIFSSTVKGIDPSGFSYKLRDYLEAFNAGFLGETSLALAIVIIATEFFTGFSILFNVRQKAGIWLAMLMMSLFTPLTLFLAIDNPVTDCGCFGDAIHLTNWQTFIKNIILFIPALYLFITRRGIDPGPGHKREWSAIAIAMLLFLVFIFYNLRFLPVIDFLPYQKGTRIAEKMKLPDDMPGDVYNTTFIYEKEGKQEKFTVDNYPAKDTTWKFIRQESVLVSKGVTPDIHDFNITTTGKGDITDLILSSPGFTMLMISGNLSKAKAGSLEKGFELGRFCIRNNIDFYIVTASNSAEVDKYDNGLSFCFADETTLKTMIRSNPGYMLLENGTIRGKWSWANMPDTSDMIKLSASQ
jgi:hypothetical protein